MKVAIVGAGISGLATAHAIRARNADVDLLVLESGRRAGGKVWTESGPEGWLCEGGVNGFLDRVPQTLELCSAIGLSPVRAGDAARNRYVFSRGHMHRLPENPLQFLSSRLLTVAGRVRVLGEWFAPGAPPGDESVAAFATRRLGREGYEKLIDPMVSGVFAGDANALSLKSCFPRIHEIEREHGSLIRGLVSLQRRARREGRKDLPGPGPGGRLTSFAGGMAALTDTLAARLGARLRVATPVAAITRAGSRFELHLDDGTATVADQLILAVPAYVQARLLGGLDAAFAPLLHGIEYPPIAVICLGYRGLPESRRPDGFGFLVPSREQRPILGAVVDSNVFPGRAPPGATLVRCMAGGARNPRMAELPDEPLIERVTAELREIAGIAVPPDFVRIFRHEKAIPQYAIGHAARLRALDDLLQRHPGLWLTGNAFRGVSLNDCVVNAFRTAERVMAAVGPG